MTCRKASFRSGMVYKHDHDVNYQENPHCWQIMSAYEKYNFSLRVESGQSNILWDILLYRYGNCCFSCFNHVISPAHMPNYVSSQVKM